MVEYTKMHGTQNKFLVFDATEEPLDNPEMTAIDLCRQEGTDGIIIVMRTEKPEAEFRMRIINSDGSEAEMCGNGIRCLARFVIDRELTKKKKFCVDTLAGIIIPELVAENMVKVDMGIPKPGKIKEKFSIDTHTYEITTVSMGNPHCVIFVDKITDHHVLVDGPLIEKDRLFPKKTNVEFIKVLSPAELEMRVWERGAGETMACGTGTCASVAAAILTKQAEKDKDIIVHLLGGDLTVRWDSKTSHIFMTGNAEYIKN